VGGRLSTERKRRNGRIREEEGEWRTGRIREREEGEEKKEEEAEME
jgi:hypothetical protein